MNERLIKGVGIGLRSQHIHQVLDEKPDIPWFEILVDNHMAKGGLIPAQLTAVRECYELTFHCVGMSLAGTDAIDMNYLSRIKEMNDQYQPAWISDHLCFTQFKQHYTHDLLPFPYTQATLKHVAERILKIQDVLKQSLVVENVSSYVQFKDSVMDEAGFLSELVCLTDCEILLDVNNAYVNEVNHGISAKQFIDSLPLEKVREIHLAGYQDEGEYLIDAHNNKVSQKVWNLYQYLIQCGGSKPTLIEWDNDIPALTALMHEANCAQNIMDEEIANKNIKQAQLCI